MTRRTGKALALTLMLCGCGSDGGEKQIETKIPRLVATAPAPTPSPSPTPTPTPSSVRSYTYEKATDFSRDRTFIGYDGVKGMAVDDKDWLKVDFIQSETSVTSFAVHDETITLADSADLPAGGVFPEAKPVGVSSDAIVGSTSSFWTVALGLPKELSSYIYFALALFKSQTAKQVMIVGSPTNPSELSQAAPRSYLAMIAEDNNTDKSVQPLPLSIDFQKGTVTGTVPVVNANGTVMQVELTGTYAQTNHVTGSLSSANGGVSGKFQGRLFGPGGKEIALLIISKDGTVLQRQSLLTGRSQ
jgi:hypothetical protein